MSFYVCQARGFNIITYIGVHSTATIQYTRVRGLLLRGYLHRWIAKTIPAVLGKKSRLLGKVWYFSEQTVIKSRLFPSQEAIEVKGIVLILRQLVRYLGCVLLPANRQKK